MVDGQTGSLPSARNRSERGDGEERRTVPCSARGSGQANKEIGPRLQLSPHTVGAHLYKVFPKLGITSRAALAHALDNR
ncbi:LuxR C-terminal-related transcriptional regulator [Kitasatospora sp. NPDC001132]